MKIALLGDIAFFGKFTVDNDIVFQYFKEIKKILCKYDFVIGNLETPFANDAKPFGAKSAYISSSPKNVELLKYLGVNLVNLANNHIYDFGEEAYQLTKQVLDDNKIGYFGIENKNYQIEKGATKISCEGFCCYSTNPLGMGPKGVNALDYQVIENLLTQNNIKGINTILSIHAGQEHVNYPNLDHVQFARKMSEIGPYIYYGHHPHVLQGIESYNKSLIAYSLGNFCFDDVYTEKSEEPLIKQNDNNKSSMVLGLEYDKNNLARYNPIPIFAGPTKMEIGSIQIANKLSIYSLTLKKEEKDYKTMRENFLKSFTHSRKTKRNRKWYWQRINIRTLLIIKDLILNKRKYNSCLKRHLT